MCFYGISIRPVDSMDVRKKQGLGAKRLILVSLHCLRDWYLFKAIQQNICLGYSMYIKGWL